MEESRLELALQELVARLEVLQLTDFEDGSETLPINFVTRDLQGAAQSQSAPLILIDDTMQDVEEFLNIQQTKVMKPVMVVLICEKDDDRPRFATTRQADLKRGIFNNAAGVCDLTLGGYADIIRVKHVTNDHSIGHLNYVDLKALVEIQLRHKINDPTAIV